MGINTICISSIQSFGAFWAGLAGCLFAAKMRFVSPESFTFMESVLILCMVIIGGIGSIAGVIIGAVVLVFLPEVLREMPDVPDAGRRLRTCLSDGISGRRGFSGGAMHLLEVRALSKHFGGIRAIEEISFSVRGGAIMSIIGPNGAGKTTLFNCLTGFIKPDEGQRHSS